MDVGYFISELLAQNGNVSVPGLGNFTHTRINGHYNEKEGKLYPPTYSVQFDPQSVDDVTLAQYIADKKNISLASSKYFTDKFINSVKLLAQSAEAPLADMGWFYTQDAQLFFRPNTDISTDPDFFGYQPIKLSKLGTSIANMPAASTESYAAPVAIAVPVEANKTSEEFETDDEEAAYLVKQSHKRRRNSILTFVTLLILFTALAVYLVNKYNPAIFSFQAPKPKPAPKEAVITARVDTTKVKDTTKTVLPADTTVPVKNTPTKDTLSKVNTFATDSLSTRWEVLGGTFKKLEEANRSLKNYKILGVEARLVQGVPDRRFRITLGTYKTRDEAAKAIRELLKEKKVSKDIYPLEIKPKL